HDLFRSLGGQITLAGLGEIENGLTGLDIEDLSANRHPDRYILAILAVAVRSLAVMAAFGLMFRVITKVEQSIKPLVGFDPDAASAAAVAARGPASRDKFFAAKRSDTVS